MPTRANPKWGWTGAVQYVQRDDALGARDNHAESAGDQRLTVYQPLTRAQCDEYLKLLGLTLLDGQWTEFYERLNWIHEFVFKHCLRQAQHPRKTEINAALHQIGQHLRVFLIASERLHLDWLADESPIHASGPLTVFWLFSQRLRSLADHARFKARHNGDAQLDALAKAADQLGHYLALLDAASQDKISKELHEEFDYAVLHLVDAVRVAQRLDHAAQTALEKSKKNGGPLPQPVMVQATIWLGELVERHGGRFSHNPYQKLEYDGAPQTPAGQFVLKFFRTCLPSITPQTASNWMATAIRFRNRRRRRKFDGRKGSF